MMDTKEPVADEFQILPRDIIERVALELQIKVNFDHDQNSDNNLMMRERPPIISIMGHIDHGKTTLLDAFRHSNRVDEEFGSITQNIGAFTFTTEGSKKETTFIDTPGHESFINLRMRGAQVTDLILLVISAVEGVQPQTLEVLDIVQRYNIPLVIALNKIDRAEANIDNVLS